MTRSSFHRMPALPMVISVFWAMIDQHALEHFVQVEGLARRVAVIPFQLAGIGVQRQGGIGVKREAVPIGVTPASRL